MSKQKKIAEAQFSSAGDDFHVRWTMKRCFDLLNFNSKGLKFLTIENTELNFAKKVDPYGKYFLGIDLVEYFGGENFNTANSIEIIQLKYSTRRANKNFTFSSLYQGKKQKSFDGSIIHRFGQLFKKFIDEYGRDEVIKKLKIKLISNREFNGSQNNVIKQIQKHLLHYPQKKTINIINKVPLTYSNFKALENIKSATKLNSSEFVDFLRVINFDECGIGSRSQQKLEIVSALCRLGSQNAIDQFNNVFQLVWNKMMPESDENNCISKEDILHEFGFDRIEDLYPVKQKFESLQSIVKREQIDNIVSGIVSNNKPWPICIHGGAGIGKSTLIKSIPKYLPKYYQSILFDCYGAGEYLNPSDKRHSHKEALLHLSNVIAKKVGSSFLLNKNMFPEDYIREFKRRIEDAVKILKNRNSDSKLVLFIDAVDNSIAASEKDSSTSFVKDLLQEQLPIGCELVISFRTYRIDSLDLKPRKYLDIRIKPFSLEETDKFLSSTYGYIDKPTIEEFHIRTGGIPRVQAYSIRPTLEETMELLKAEKVTTVEGLIETNIEIVAAQLDEKNSLKLDNVEQKIGEIKTVSKFLKYLVALPRPVPIEIIQECTSLSESIIRDISVDIWGGLIFSDDKFSFNDEDFENYIKQNYNADQKDFFKIAAIFLKNATRNEYASINLGIFLFKSDQTELLKQIVLERNYLKVPSDLIKQKEVYIDRTRLAMKVSQSTDDNVSFVKLLMIAAEQAKTDNSLTNLLVRNVELAIAYSDTNTIHRLLLESENSWYGTIHYQLAAINSRTPALIEKAKIHLKSASNWMVWRSRQKENDIMHDYPITNEDIAYGAEAYFRIFGIEKTFKWLDSWSPKSILIDVTERLVHQVFQQLTYEEVIKEIKKVNLRLDIKIVLFNVGFKYFGLRPIFDTGLILNRLEHIGDRKVQFTKIFSRRAIEAIENILQFKPNKEKVHLALSVLKTNPFRRPPSITAKRFYFDNESKHEMDVFLRTEAIIAGLDGKSIKIEDYYPKDFKEIEKIKDYKKRRSLSKDKEEFDRFFKHAIPIYQFRAIQFLSGFKKAKDTQDVFNALCDKIENDFDFRYYDDHRARFKLNFLSGLITDLAVGYGHKEWVDRITTSFAHNNLNYISLRFEILERIINYEVFNDKSLTLLDEIDLYIKKSNFTASDAIESYIDCCLLAKKINETTGKYFFDEAVKAVADIDIEAQDQIKCVNNLSNIGIPNPNPEMAYEFSRFVEYSSIKLGGYDHFPLREGILAIANIDPGSVLTIGARWHHRYVLDLTEHMGSILKAILEKEYLTCDVVGSLLPLNIYIWDEFVEICKVLIEQFDSIADDKKKKYFVKCLINDVKLKNAEGISSRIYELIKDNKFLNGDVVNDLKIYVDFIDSLKNNTSEKSAPTTTFNEKENPKQEKKQYYIKDVNYTLTSSIEEHLKVINIKSKSHFNRPTIDDFFREIKEKCKPKEFIPHLNALIDINPELITFYSLKNALEDRFMAWDYMFEVREWKRNKFKYFLQIWFSHFSWGNDISIYEVKNIAELFSVSDLELSIVITDILPETIDTISASTIYQSVELIQHKLSKEENETILRWTIEKWNQIIKNDFGDGEWNKNLKSSGNPMEIVSGFLRFILGDPDKRNRWRAIHCIKRLVHQDNTIILKILLRDQNKIDCHPFQNREYPFYWISSKLYLWVVIEKLTKETPARLVQFKNQIYAELGNTNLPHALIIYFIKQSCLNLYEHDSSIFTDKEYNKISKTLLSRLPKIKERTLSKSQHRSKSKTIRVRSFNFDSMDTLPYWYEGLARPFNLSSIDVADIADKYISEKWGYVGNPNKDNHVQVQGSNNWYMTSNRQGSIPIIENLEKYYEYHAMYCAASELLDEENLIESKYEGEWGTWKYWLESDAYTWKDFWISDLTDSLPYDKKFWESEYSIYNKEWKVNIAEHKYDEVIGLANTSSNEFLTLYGGYTRHFGDNYEPVTVRSALVSKKTSKALLRAMQLSKNHYDYNLPLEEGDSELAENQFKLIGWLKEVHTDYEGLDESDPFGKKICKNYVQIGNIVSKYLELEYSKNLKEATLNGDLVSTYTSWDVNTEYRGYDKLESDGGILKIKIGFLLDILKKLKKDLIVECHISRELRERDYSFKRDRSDSKNTAKLYLIHANGKVETIGRGSYKIGQ